MENQTTMTCANCGYDLSGLPPEGRCPECGQEYSRTRGEGLSHLEGPAEPWARGYRLVARARTVIFLVLAVGVLALGIMISTMVNRGAATLAIATLIAVVLLLASVTSYFYE